jgi:hypothetical protein
MPHESDGASIMHLRCWQSLLPHDVMLVAAAASYVPVPCVIKQNNTAAQHTKHACMHTFDRQHTLLHMCCIATLISACKALFKSSTRRFADDAGARNATTSAYIANRHALQHEIASQRKRMQCEAEQSVLQALQGGMSWQLPLTQGPYKCSLNERSRHAGHHAVLLHTYSPITPSHPRVSQPSQPTCTRPLQPVTPACIRNRTLRLPGSLAVCNE